MSTSPFFQSAGRGDFLSQGLGGKRRTNGRNVRAYQNKKRQAGWKRQARRTTGLCGAFRKKGRRKSAHLSSAGKSSSLTIQRPPKNGEIAFQTPRTSRLPDC